jgi:hypothetical protein
MPRNTGIRVALAGLLNPDRPAEKAGTKLDKAVDDLTRGGSV